MPTDSKQIHRYLNQHQKVIVVIIQRIGYRLVIHTYIYIYYIYIYIYIKKNRYIYIYIK